MTLVEAKQKFDFRWTVLSAVTVTSSSFALLRLSWSSAALAGIAALTMVVSGYMARQILTEEKGSAIRAQRLRVAAIVLAAIICAAIKHLDQRLIMFIALIMLWMASVNVFLQIAARYASQYTLLAFVQYLGDYLVAVFLVLAGADWLVIAALLVFAGATAAAAAGKREQRLLLFTALSAAGLFMGGIPASARFLSVYLTLLVFVATWSAGHLVALASHARASESSADVPGLQEL